MLLIFFLLVPPDIGTQALAGDGFLFCALGHSWPAQHRKMAVKDKE
jgi:hypothetical protein